MYANPCTLSLVFLSSMWSQARNAVQFVCIFHNVSWGSLLVAGRALTVHWVCMSQENVAEAAEAMARLQKELDDVSRQRDVLADQHRRAEEELKGLETQVRVLTDERDRKVEEAGTLNSSLTNLTVAHDKLRGQIENNVSENKELVSKLVAVEKMRIEHEKKMEMLHSELQQVKEAKAKDVSGLQKQVSQTLEQNKTLEDKLQQSEHDAAVLSQEKEASLAEAAQLRSALDDFVGSHEELKDEMLHLEQELGMDMSKQLSSDFPASDQNPVVVKVEQRRALRAARPTDVHEKHEGALAPQSKTSQDKGWFQGMFASKSANTESGSHHDVDADSETSLASDGIATASLSAVPPPPRDSPYLQMISYKHTQQQLKMLVSALKAQIARKDQELEDLRMSMQQKQALNDSEAVVLKQKLQEAEESQQDQIKMVRYVTIQLEETKQDAEKIRQQSIREKIKQEQDVKAANDMLSRANESTKTLETKLVKKEEEIDKLQVEIASNVVEITSLQGKVEAAEEAFNAQIVHSQNLSRQIRDLHEERTNAEHKERTSNQTITQTTQRMQELEENVGQKEAEIASLTAAMEKTKQEASEYATHLEGEVESVQASMFEAAEELKRREEQAVRFEEQLSSLYKDMDLVRGEKEALEQSLSSKNASLRELSQRSTDLTAELGAVQATLERTKQEAAEYASHLEQEVETSKASIMEAAEELKAREDQAARLEEELSLAVSNVQRLQKDYDRASLEVENLTIDRDSKMAEATSLGSSLTELTNVHEKLLQQSARRDDELALLLKDVSGLAPSKGAELQEVVMNRQEPDSAKSSEGVGFIVKKENRKALRAARPNPLSTAQAQSIQQAAEVNKTAVEAKSMTSILRDQMSKKDQEITHLQGKLDELQANFESLRLSTEKSRRESEEYATHLEEEVETSKNSIAEAAATMQALENDVITKDTELIAARLVCQEHQESITNLETKLQDVMANAEKARKEATEYATHLEEEVETSKVRHIPFVRAGLFPYYCTLIRGSLNELM